MEKQNIYMLYLISIGFYDIVYLSNRFSIKSAEGGNIMTKDNQTLNTQDNKNVVEVTREQLEFIKGKEHLRIAKEYLDAGRLSQKAYTEYCKGIYDHLFNQIKNYAIHVLLTECRYNLYSHKQEMIANALQECYLVFHERLEFYDPVRSSPTTYYGPRFKRAGFDCLGLRRPDQISDYFYRNMKKIQEAINVLSIENRSIDFQLLEEMTGLSERVIHETYKRFDIYNGSVEDLAYSLKSNMQTPEQYAIENEEKEALYEAIKETLTPLEFELLQRKIEVDGEFRYTYERLSQMYDIPVRRVKQMINNAKIKLSSNEHIKNQYGRLYGSEIYKQYSFQDNAADVAEKQLFDYFNKK